MTHPLVSQLHFARREFKRCLAGVSAEDGLRRLESQLRPQPGAMNCISWIVGHLALQEHAYWCVAGQGHPVDTDLQTLVGYGRPASTPPLAEMWSRWDQITTAADVYLNTLTPDLLQTHFVRDGQPERENIGTRLLRNIFHYWHHLGEAHAIRQQLGHQNLPDFVGDMSEVRF